MAEHFVYILECADKSFYVGSSSDPELRLEYHRSGRGGAYTSKRRPVTLVFTEKHTSLEAARAREKQIKRWSHDKKAALVAGDGPRLHQLSRRRRLE